MAARVGDVRDAAARVCDERGAAARVGDERSAASSSFFFSKQPSASLEGVKPLSFIPN